MSEETQLPEVETEVTLTETELKLAKELDSKRRAIQQEAAAISLQQLQLDYRQGKLEDFYAETLELEKQVTENLSSKYGNGSIDLEKGVFVPA